MAGSALVGVVGGGGAWTGWAGLDVPGRSVVDDRCPVVDGRSPTALGLGLGLRIADCVRVGMGWSGSQEVNCAFMG